MRYTLDKIIIVITALFFTSSAFSEGPPNHRNAVAIVHGKPLYKQDCETENCIVQTLIEDFGIQNSVAPTESELTQYCSWSETRIERRKTEAEKLEKELTSRKLSDRQKREKQADLESLRAIIKMNEEDRLIIGDKYSEICREAASKLFVGRWKIMNALYKRYKGRLAITKFGPVPVDAIRSMIVEEEKKGSFTIFDKDTEEKFRKSLETDGSKYYEQNKGEAELARPPWVDKE